MLRCGIDLIEIERIQDGVDRFGDRFLDRFFTVNERTGCENMVHRLAARLAGKEAVAKAFGTGIGDISWKEIEILSDARGRPVLHLHGEAAKLAQRMGLTQWDISLTHTKDHASAVVVAMSA